MRTPSVVVQRSFSSIGNRTPPFATTMTAQEKDFIPRTSNLISQHSTNLADFGKFWYCYSASLRSDWRCLTHEVYGNRAPRRRARSGGSAHRASADSQHCRSRLARDLCRRREDRAEEVRARMRVLREPGGRRAVQGQERLRGLLEGVAKSGRLTQMPPAVERPAADPGLPCGLFYGLP